MELEEHEKKVVTDYLNYLELWFLGRQFDPELAQEASDAIETLRGLVRDAELL